jgi:hypothetical protein
MPRAPEKSWAELKAEGRMRYFEIVNSKLLKAWCGRWLLYGSIVRSTKDPRELPEKLAGFFPDAWSKPSRWFYDHLLAEKRLAARAWMHGRPIPVPNTLLDSLLSWKNPNKEYRV